MRVAFCYPGFESLSIEMLSAALKQHGHDARLFYDPQLFDDFFIRNRRLARAFEMRDDLVERVVAWRPDAVGLSVVTHNYRWALDIARRIKRRSDVPIVMGGVHATLLPEKTLENDAIDYVVRGEGEFALLELLESLDGRRDVATIRNLCFRDGPRTVCNPLRPLFEGLETLPPPDKSLYDDVSPHFRIGYQTITGRGCPYRCSYCFNNYYKKQYDRGGSFVFRRKPEDVLAELEDAKGRGRLRFVMFVDENFYCDADWTDTFLAGYRERIRVPFWCLAHPGTVNDDVVSQLAASGCVEAQMGVETVNTEIKKTVLLRNETVEQVANAIDTFGRHGIRLSTDNIVNLPGHTPDDLRNLANFYIDHTPWRINAYWLLYFPKIDITTMALARGMIDERAVEALENGEAETAFFGGSRFDPRLAVFPLLFFLITAAKPVARWFLRGDRLRWLPFVGFGPVTALIYGIALVRGIGKPRNTVLQKRTIARYLRFMPIVIWQKWFRSWGSPPRPLPESA